MHRSAETWKVVRAPLNFAARALTEGVAQAFIVYDISSAYRSLFCKSYQECLQVMWHNGQPYASSGLCFGLKSAAHIWGSVASLVQFILNTQIEQQVGLARCSVTSFGDDFLICVRYAADAARIEHIVDDTFKQLGAPVNAAKKQRGMRLVFLGVQLCSFTEQYESYPSAWLRLLPLSISSWERAKKGQRW